MTPTNTVDADFGDWKLAEILEIIIAKMSIMEPYKPKSLSRRFQCPHVKWVWLVDTQTLV